jgi:hypothetical protein
VNEIVATEIIGKNPKDQRTIDELGAKAVFKGGLR